MKIVVIGPVYPYRGGIAHFTTELVKAMIDEGHQVDVISFKRQYPRFLYPGKTDKDPSKNPTIIPASFILDPIYPWTWFQAYKEVKKIAPDLVVFQWWTTFWAPAFGMLTRWLKSYDIKSTYIIHNVFPHESTGFDKILISFAFTHADRFIAMSVAQKEIIVRDFPGKSVIFLPHPKYFPKEHQFLDKKAARRQLGIQDNHDVVLFFGFVRPYKGLKLLIEAVGILKKKGIPIHLLVAGEFWESVDEYKNLIKTEDIEKWVIIQNRYIPDEEVDLFFNASDVLVAPYIGGTQSGAVKLALGYGISAIVSEILFSSEGSADAPNIRPFSPTTSEGLASSIQLWMESKDINKSFKMDQNIDYNDWHLLAKTLTNNILNS